MATYNGAAFVKEQIESILTQLGSNDELIISDDCSIDQTLDIIKSYNDKRIILLSGKRFASPILNFEYALKHVKGDIIFLADQDDIWASNKVEVCIDVLKSCDLILHDANIIDAYGNILHTSFFKLRNVKNGYWTNLYKNSYIGCCMAFRASVLKYTLPFPKQIAMHDMWIALKVLLNGKSVFIDEPLLKYRRHGQNASFSAEKSQLSKFYQFIYRIKMLYYTRLT
ncbi:MAG: glycosyltransferase family 2 protein [Bacteroidales bacterium]